MGITFEFDEQFNPEDTALAESATREIIGDLAGEWHVRFFNDSRRRKTYGVRVRTGEGRTVQLFEAGPELATSIRSALRSAVSRLTPQP